MFCFLPIKVLLCDQIHVKIYNTFVSPNSQIKGREEKGS